MWSNTSQLSHTWACAALLVNLTWSLSHSLCVSSLRNTHTDTEQRIWYLTDRLVGCGDSFGGAARERARTCLGALSLYVCACVCVWHIRININLITSISQLKALCKAHKPTDLYRGRERERGMRVGTERWDLERGQREGDEKDWHQLRSGLPLDQSGSCQQWQPVWRVEIKMAMGRRNKKTRGESERKTHSTCVKHRQRVREEGEKEKKRLGGREKGKEKAGSSVVSTSIRWCLLHLRQIDKLEAATKAASGQSTPTSTQTHTHRERCIKICRANENSKQQQQ